MWIRQKRVAVAGVAIMGAGLGLAAPSLAQADAEPASEPAVEIVESDSDLGPDGEAIDCEAFFDEAEWAHGEVDEGDWEEWIPSPEELEDINAETDDLVSFLEENGVSVDVETDDLGFSFPLLDEDTDEAVFDLIEQFFADRYDDDQPIHELDELDEDELDEDELDEPGELGGLDEGDLDEGHLDEGHLEGDLDELECFFDEFDFDDAELCDPDSIDDLELSAEERAELAELAERPELAELAESFGLDAEELAELAELLVD